MSTCELFPPLILKIRDVSPSKFYRKIPSPVQICF